MKRILVINPNTSERTTQHIKNNIKKVKHVDTFFEVINPRKGPESIESYYDISMVVPEMIKLVKDKSQSFDAMVIACFGDPGLETFKEILDIPVIGIMEASIHIASMLGEKFSIISINKRRASSKWRYIRSIGLINRMVSVIPIDMSVVDMEKDPEMMLSRIVDAALKAKEEGAEVVILGCASMSGYSEEIMKKTGLTVIDPVAIGFKLAEILAELNLSQSKVGIYSKPRNI